jgi:hypothetical protein
MSFTTRTPLGEKGHSVSWTTLVISQKFNEEIEMNENYGWTFWQDAELIAVTDEWRIRVFRKDGVFCLCEPGVEPGDAESFVTGNSKLVAKWLYDMQFHPCTDGWDEMPVSIARFGGTGSGSFDLIHLLEKTNDH